VNAPTGHLWPHGETFRAAGFCLRA
jgi:hypothetical protein